MRLQLQFDSPACDPLARITAANPKSDTRRNQASTPGD
jgi:hypothetical protein